MLNEKVQTLSAPSYISLELSDVEYKVSCGLNKILRQWIPLISKKNWFQSYLFQSIIKRTKHIRSSRSLASKSRNLILPGIIIIIINLYLKITIKNSKDTLILKRDETYNQSITNYLQKRFFIGNWRFCFIFYWHWVSEDKVPTNRRSEQAWGKEFLQVHLG